MRFDHRHGRQSAAGEDLGQDELDEPGNPECDRYAQSRGVVLGYPANRVQQRANFILAGVLYSCAAVGLGRSDRRRIGPRAVPALIAGAGIGLIGSGLFVTDYVGDLLDKGPDEKNRGQADGATTRPTRTGQMHNLCGIPVFAGIPIAGLASAATAVHSRDYRWAFYSAGSSMVMACSLRLFGAAIRGQSRLGGKSGIFQRISIATGLGWLSSLSLRVLSQ